MEKFLSDVYFGNSVLDYLIAAGLVLIPFFIIPFIFKLVKNIGNSESPVRKSLRKIIIPLLYLASIYMAVQSLTMPEIMKNVFVVAFLVAATFLVTRAIILLVGFGLTNYIENRTQETQQTRLKPLLAFINFIIWIAGILFLLDNLGFEIATIIAGLGVGGVAIALASQSLLGDLFSYFVIFFDEPFKIGDFVTFDEKLGVVEKIGIKSTRIRALGGEQLIVSNSNLLNARVHNYKRMERRRVLFQIGVVYGTDSEKLRYISDKIKSIIEGIENTEFDRCHFFRYGNFSLDFETVYYINTNDYNTYMNIHQQINLAIYEDFEKQGIEFAYPTQTLYLNKNNGSEERQSSELVEN